ncbi:hypothetical protein UPYG_G00333140 [Umbra pygmaea]|uniref:Uncharacterized protein n=1 Tax=Umbra pygmaea TaxID=75934 RepID=A0ABD0WA12_UMBPY
MIKSPRRRGANQQTAEGKEVKTSALSNAEKGRAHDCLTVTNSEHQSFARTGRSHRALPGAQPAQVSESCRRPWKTHTVEDWMSPPQQ